MDSRFDVLVVGGGLAGLLAADSLAEHARVCLVDSAGLPAACSDRGLGLAAAGGMDSPARLKHALGAEAEAIWIWSARSVACLLDRAESLGVSVRRSGSRRLSLDEREWAEWSTSLELLRRWGLPARALDPDELAGCGRDLAGGVALADDGWVDLPALLAALRDRVAGRVDVVRGEARLEGSFSHVEASVGEQRVDAEIAVVAAGVGSRSVTPWFEPMLYPVRLQGLRVPGAGLEVPPSFARHRFEAWTSEPDGSLAFVGCRWAEQPEMEAGVLDDTAISAAVEARSLEFVAAGLPELDLSGASSWTGIAAGACDGLPLVGPLPGRPRVLSLCGWGGWGLSWIAQGVDDVVNAVLGRGQTQDTPAPLRPRRMV